MFAIIKKPARNWRTEIMRESHSGRQLLSRKAAGPASQVKVFSCGRLVQTAGQRSLVARGEPRLGGGGVCNTQETCTQLADRNHAMELSQTSVAGRKVAGPASRVNVFSCEGAGPDSRSEVARGEPRLGGSSVCSTQEAYMQRPDRNPAREL